MTLGSLEICLRVCPRRSWRRSPGPRSGRTGSSRRASGARSSGWLSLGLGSRGSPSSMSATSFGFRPASTSSSRSRRRWRGQRPGQLQPLLLSDVQLASRACLPLDSRPTNCITSSATCAASFRDRFFGPKQAPTVTFSLTVSSRRGRTIWWVRAMPRLGDLEGRQAGDVLAPKQYLALLGRVDTVDHVEQGGLAGPVRTDDSEDLALPPPRGRHRSRRASLRS